MVRALAGSAARAKVSVVGHVNRAADLVKAAVQAAAALSRTWRAPKLTAEDARLAVLLARPRLASAAEDLSFNRRWARAYRWAFALSVRASLVVTIYFILLIPALLNNPELAATPNLASVADRDRHLPAEFEADQLAVFVSIIDSTVNQSLALALPMLLLLNWSFKNVFQTQERRSLINNLCLLIALVLTLCSITAGMETKWRLMIHTPILLGVVKTPQPMPADYLADKVMWQQLALLRAFALTLACLPAMLIKAPQSRQEQDA